MRPFFQDCFFFFYINIFRTFYKKLVNPSTQDVLQWQKIKNPDYKDQLEQGETRKNMKANDFNQVSTVQSPQSIYHSVPAKNAKTNNVGQTSRNLYFYVFQTFPAKNLTTQ